MGKGLTFAAYDPRGRCARVRPPDRARRPSAGSRLSRVSGWTAHVLDQYAYNRLIRPRTD